MQWLVDAGLDAAVADALKRHGHVVHALQELDLTGDADVLKVLQAAASRQWELVSARAAIANAAIEHGFARCVVYLRPSDGPADLEDPIDRLFERFKRLSPQRLYTVTAARVKVRQVKRMVNEE